MSKSTIALNIIMRDVSDTIIPCLASIGNKLDKYIFVDTGSKDNTKDLVENWCKENRVDYKIIDYKGYKFSKKDKRDRKNWGDIPQYDWDFGDARQIALWNTDTNWIFWTDADDIVTGIDAIRTIITDAEFNNSSTIYFPYHYAQDQMGNDAIYQYRERLIRVKQDGKRISEWKRPVHEFCQVDGEVAKQIAVRTEVHIYHKRTIEHVIETNRRNNRILYKELEEQDRIGKRDMRTLSVLAFDHYEHREWEESIRYYKQLFELVAKEKDLAEPQYFNHYSSYARACISVGDFELAHKNIERMITVNPQLIEPYLLKAEIYILMGNLDLAEEYIKLAERKPPVENMSPTSPLEMKLKPLLMRVEIEGKRGNLEKGLEYLTRALQIVPNDGNLQTQRRNMLDNLSVKDAYNGIFALREELFNTGELEKFINLIAVVPNSLLNRQEIVQIMNEAKAEWDYYKQRMGTKLKGKKKICIYIGPAYEDWNPKTIKEKGSGGSEEMGMRMASELSKLGHEVVVYNQCGLNHSGTFDGVKYVDFRQFDEKEMFDVFIAERTPGVFSKRLNAKRQYLWLHDTHYGEQPRKLFNLPDKIFVLSEAHKNILNQYYRGINDTKYHITRNGIDLDMIKKGEELNVKRDPFKLIYSSSYDRGIDRLLKLFPKIKAKEPRATLDIYYGFDVYDKRMEMLLKNGDPEGKALKENKDRLLELMKQDGVTHYGRVTQQELINKYFGAGIWAYPTGFYEISCITAMLAQSCGAIPVVSDYAALSETVQYGTKLPMGYSDDEYVEKILEMMSGDFDRKEMMDWAKKKYDVKPLAKEWDKLFEE